MKLVEGKLSIILLHFGLMSLKQDPFYMSVDLMCHRKAISDLRKEHMDLQVWQLQPQKWKQVGHFISVYLHL